MLRAVENLVAYANRGYETKKEGNHSMIQTETNIKYYYYQTCICNVNKVTGKVIYSNGGWATSSTTRAINSYKQVYGAGE